MHSFDKVFMTSAYTNECTWVPTPPATTHKDTSFRTGDSGQVPVWQSRTQVLAKNVKHNRVLHIMPASADLSLNSSVDKRQPNSNHIPL